MVESVDLHSTSSLHHGPPSNTELSERCTDVSHQDAPAFVEQCHVDVNSEQSIAYECNPLLRESSLPVQPQGSNIVDITVLSTVAVTRGGLSDGELYGEDTCASMNVNSPQDNHARRITVHNGLNDSLVSSSSCVYHVHNNYLDDVYSTSDDFDPDDLACPLNSVGRCSGDPCGCSKPPTVYDTGQPIYVQACTVPSTNSVTLNHVSCGTATKTVVDTPRYTCGHESLQNVQSTCNCNCNPGMVQLNDQLSSVAKGSTVNKNRPMQQPTIYKKRHVRHTGRVTTMHVPAWIHLEYSVMCELYTFYEVGESVYRTEISVKKIYRVIDRGKVELKITKASVH